MGIVKDPLFVVLGCSIRTTPFYIFINVFHPTSDSFRTVKSRSNSAFLKCGVTSFYTPQVSRTLELQPSFVNTSPVLILQVVGTLIRSSRVCQVTFKLSQKVTYDDL